MSITKNNVVFLRSACCRLIMFSHSGKTYVHRYHDSPLPKTPSWIENCTNILVIISKIIKTIVTSCEILKAKMHPIRFRLWLRPRHRWGSLQRYTRPPSLISGDRGAERSGEKRLSWERSAPPRGMVWIRHCLQNGVADDLISMGGYRRPRSREGDHSPLPWAAHHTRGTIIIIIHVSSVPVLRCRLVSHRQECMQTGWRAGPLTSAHRYMLSIY